VEEQEFLKTELGELEVFVETLQTQTRSLQVFWTIKHTPE
jgi:hypothetical protein